MAWVNGNGSTNEGSSSYTACYRDPEGGSVPPGPSRPVGRPSAPANREEQQVLAGRWLDAARGEITFRDYVETVWLPSRHIEATTRAGVPSYLNKHFFPFFGHRQMAKILPSTSRTGSPRPPPAGCRRGASASTT